MKINWPGILCMACRKEYEAEDDMGWASTCSNLELKMVATKNDLEGSR